MNRIKYSLAVNMQDTRAVDTGIRLKQGDSGIRLVIKVFNNGEAYFDSTNIPEIVFRRPDGTSVIGTVAVDTNDYYYDIVGSELQHGGNIVCDLKFDWDETRKSTYSFIIECVSDTISESSSASSVYMADYLTVKREVDEAVSQTESDRERAEAAAETAEAVVGFDGSASTVTFDNSTSGLDADNVQDAIDEVDALANSLLGNIVMGDPITTNIDFAAGTIGTRCVSLDVNVAKSGYTPIAVTLINSSASASFDVTLMVNPANNNVQVKCYRCVSSAVSGANVAYRIIYLKNAVSTQAED